MTGNFNPVGRYIYLNQIVHEVREKEEKEKEKEKEKSVDSHSPYIALLA